MIFNNDVETTIKAVNIVNDNLKFNSQGFNLSIALKYVEEIANNLYKEKVNKGN